MPDLSGKLALVTGASSGIGAAFARRLAGWGCGLVLTARRVDRLEALAGELRGRGVVVHVVPEDLADPEGPARLHRAAQAVGPVDIVINNAGIAAFEHYLDGDWERHRALLQLDVLSLCELTWRFARDMARRRERGYVLNVASTAAVAPIEGFATYGAAKAFVQSFSMALAAELAGTSATVTATSPGPVASEFMATAGMKLGAVQRLALQSAERCADVSLAAMLRGRRVVYPGPLAKVLAFGSRFGPARLNGAVGGLLLGKPAPARIGKPEAGG